MTNSTKTSPQLAIEKARMTIVLMSDGRIHVNGPIGDRVLAYGMLECAREVIHEYAKLGPQQQEKEKEAPVLEIVN